MYGVRDARTGNGALQSTGHAMEILSVGNTGQWQLNLPEPLRGQQSELENLLGHVFGATHSEENLELAQQMTINWCISKFRKMGVRNGDTEWL
jgi:hypothetical protein